MFRNLGVRVEAVDDVEEARQFRRLFRQVGRASAAKDKNVDFVLHFVDFVDRVNADAFGQDFDRFRRTTGERGDERRIGILLDGAFDAATKVAVPNDSNSDLHLSGSINERVGRTLARAATAGRSAFPSSPSL